jgi:Ca-activated chloride channel family protein
MENIASKQIRRSKDLSLIKVKREDVKTITIGLAISSVMLAQVGEHDFKLKAAAILVMLEVSAKDREGRFVSDLTRGAFHVRENGKAQTISQFSKEDAPVTIGLVIDDSASMKTKYSEVINSAMIFLSSSNPKDQVFVVHFNDSVRVGLPKGVPFSDNPALLKASLLRNSAEGRTALYDAILLSLKHLNSGRQEKKSLLLISDGGDNASAHELKDVIEAVRESHATIYTIGIFDEDDAARNPGLLRSLANVSGGDAFFPKTLLELAPICQQIATDIRSRYTVGYVPSEAKGSDDLRRLDVSATRHGERILIRARTSYRFPKDIQE